MTKRLPIAFAVLASLAALVPTMPALAQSANDKTLVIFGNDRCPSGTICVRKGESERYRIPKEMRDSTPAAGNETWASRAKSISNVGAAGTGSCSATGAGGWTGCWSQQMRDAKAERQAIKEQENAAPH